MRPPLGIDTVNGALRIDVGLTIIEGKGMKRREKLRYGERSSDLMEWIELSAAGVKKGDKTKPRPVTQAMR